MRIEPKFRLILTAVVVFTLFLPGWGQAANLRNVRTGKHEKFTRVVFEFEDNTLFENPEINGKGNFSVVFLDSSTTLPRLTLYKTGPTQLVHSIEFVRQKANLTANVRLAFPYFILKAFPLSAPNRIVVDVFPVSSSPEKSEPTTSLREEPLLQTSKKPEESQLKDAPKKMATNDAVNPPISSSGADKSDLKDKPFPKKVISNNVSDQIPDRHLESHSFTEGHDMTQIYLLAVLNVLTSVIVVIMIFMLLKKRHVIDIGHLSEIMEFIKTSDKNIETIDAQLKHAFKEYDEF